MTAPRLNLLTVPAAAGDDGVTAPLAESLAGLRRSLAEAWLAMTPEVAREHYAGRTGKIHRLIVKTAAPDAPGADDATLLAAIRARLADTAAPAPGALLAAMRYPASIEFSRFADPAVLPDWLLGDVIDQLLADPPLFRAAGDADDYAEGMMRRIAQLRDAAAIDPMGERGHRIAAQFTTAARCHTLYFNHRNLRETFRARAQLLEMAQAAGDTELDWEFATRADGAPLKVGVLSFNFSAGAETFATLPLIRHLDRRRFHVTLYALRGKNSAIEQACAESADRFVLLPRDTAARVAALRADDLDLVYLGTNVTAAAHEYTLLALHRLARVQVAGVCSCVTTGMRNVDCYLSGRLSEPADAQDHYTEKLYCIEGAAHCYDFGPAAPAAAAGLRRDDAGIPRDAVVFASGANFYKILPEVEALWLRVLAAVPDSRLVLYPFNPQWDNNYPRADFMSRLAAALAHHGIDPARLLVFDTARDRQEVMQRLALADLYLDSFPFSGATSLLDPLLAGIPPVVLDGNSFRSLVGPAILRDLGLGELVAADTDAYLKLAVRLAANAGLRRELADKVSATMRKAPAIFDGARYGAQVSNVFEQMWRDCGAGRAAR